MLLEHDLTATSGAGKTQFLLGLLLATQLPPHHGLIRSALYISTESAIPTTRVSQMLSTHSILISAGPKSLLDRVICIVTRDLESQDHILRYQLPVAIRRHNIGPVVLDSVAANYKAEFKQPGASKNGANMGKRLAH
jgi:DNA repair protein RAD57